MRATKIMLEPRSSWYILTSRYRNPIMHSAVAAKSNMEGMAKKKYIQTGVVLALADAPFALPFLLGNSASVSVAPRREVGKTLELVVSVDSCSYPGNGMRRYS